MSQSILGGHHASDDILALRHLIEHIADHCGIDLTDRLAVRRLMDGDLSLDRSNNCNHPACQELPAMIKLLFRLETSSSEDLGISGLRRLWTQHSQILARFRVGTLKQGTI